MAIPAGSSIAGVEVRVKARSTDTTGCSIGVQLSWDDGVTWTSQKTRSITGSFPTSPYPTLGGATDNWGHTWVPAEVANGRFVLRVTDVDPGTNCVDTARTDLDYVTVKVFYTGPATEQPRQIPAADGSALCGGANCSQGFWGAIEGQGSNRSTGDAYATGAQRRRRQRRLRPRRLRLHHRDAERRRHLPLRSDVLRDRQRADRRPLRHRRPLARQRRDGVDLLPAVEHER